MADPLVADPVDLSTPFTGTFLLEDGETLAHAIQNGDWIEGGLAAFSGALDTAATISDPLGSLIAAGLGWVLEHVEPLRGWFNDLTGDAGEVAGYARTWSNIATRMHDSGDLYTRRLTDLDDMSGATIDAYRAYATDTAKHLHATGDWAQAVATGLELCSTLVTIVHDLVRDALSQLVGMIISIATEAIATAGFALPLIIEQVTTRVTALATRVGTSITRLLTSFKSFTALFEALQELMRRGKSLFDRMPPGKTGRNALPGTTPYRGLPLPEPGVRPPGRAPIPDDFDPYGGLTREEYLRRHWDFEEGGWRYPDDSGFDMSPDAPRFSSSLMIGQRFGRFGGEFGKYVSPLDVPLPQRSLPPDALLKEYHQYEVVRSLDAESGLADVGLIAPAFEQPGGGIQIKLPRSVDWLVAHGYLRRID